MKKPLVPGSVTLGLLLVASPLLSHDFWLVPNAFHIAAGGELTVEGRTSSEFPTSLSAVTVDRVESARLITAAGEEAITDLGVSDVSLRLRHRPKNDGQAIVAVRVRPRSIPESPESFREYVRLEGAPDALARYEAQGILPTDSITRRYAKYAKVLVHIGRGGEPVHARAVGHPLEFVTLGDPATTTGALRVRMLFQGRPLPHARGHVSVAESASSERAFHGAEFETDASGEFTVDLGGRHGVWNVRALYIVPAPAGSGADWDVHWATLVWNAGH